MHAATTTSPTAHLPLTLRQEPFGGILFDPFDATMLELDHEAFDVAKTLARPAAFCLSRKRRRMRKLLKHEIYYHRKRKIRIMELPHDKCPTPTELPVLNAPTLVDFQITNRCEMGCPHCYAEASPQGTDVAWFDIQNVINQMADCGVCQLAIGGGEPLLHPQIIELLDFAHHKGIVPNLTTSGFAFDEAKLNALAIYCGAVGISMEGVGESYAKIRSRPFTDFEAALARLRAHRIPTVIQITLSADNFSQLDAMTRFCLEQPDLYGVIFLAYKPVGRGQAYSQPLAALDVNVVTNGLARAFQRLSPVMRVGYDCCMTPAIAGVEDTIPHHGPTGMEGCSGMRGSLGISTDLEVHPCTFLTDHKIGNLKSQSLSDIWKQHQADHFRQTILDHAQCECGDLECARFNECQAGCPVMKLVNCQHAITRTTGPA